MPTKRHRRIRGTSRPPSGEVPSACTATLPDEASKEMSLDPDFRPKSAMEWNGLIVGIGASNGGLEAFQEIFEHLPSRIDAAYVLLHHLDSPGESDLAALLARTTTMPVRVAHDGEKIEGGRIYVIPSHVNLILEDSTLKQLDRTTRSGPNLPIDLFFRSLAESQRDRAIAVVLSGTGNDGTEGVRAVRAADGWTIAQEPSTARSASMPTSAIDAGHIDFVMHCRDIGSKVSEISAHLRDEAQRAEHSSPFRSPEDSRALRSIEDMIGRPKNDTSTSTMKHLENRIERRMFVRSVATATEYARLLETDGDERRILGHNPSSDRSRFFRAETVLATIARRVAPEISANHTGTEPVRVWIPGCSRGESAYSLAIVLDEVVRASPGIHPGFKIFATDVSDAELDVARSGIFSSSIAESVPEERLSRYFEHSGNTYRIADRIRAGIVFARHDIAVDPPFLQLGLIDGRHLAFDRDSAAQRATIEKFHTALLPRGFLILGQSGPAPTTFADFEPSDGIYRKRSEESEKSPTATPRSTFLGPGNAKPNGDRSEPVRDPDAGVTAECRRVLTDLYLPASVLVDARLRVVRFFGDTEPYIRRSTSDADLDVRHLVRDDLRSNLIDALERSDAIARGGPRTSYRKIDDRNVRITVIPIEDSTGEASRHLVVFDGTPTAPMPHRVQKPHLRLDDRKDRRIARLEDDLVRVSESHQLILDARDLVREEMQTASEETICSNEELQRINEALEYAKFELERTNDDLTKLNTALVEQNRELEAVGEDLLNLIAGVDIPILMLGRKLELKRSTRSAQSELGISPSDVGKRFFDLETCLRDPSIESDAQSVFLALAVGDREIVDGNGRFRNLKMRPFLTTAGTIDGVILSMIDVDAMKRSVKEVESARDSADAIVETARSGFLILDTDLVVGRANRSFYETFRLDPAQTIGRRIGDVGQGEWKFPELETRLGRLVQEGGSFDGLVVAGTFRELGPMTIVMNGRVLPDDPGSPGKRILLAIEDMNRSRAGEEAKAAILAEAAWNAELQASRMKDEFVATVSHELRGPLNAIAGWSHILGAPSLPPNVLAKGLAVIDRSIKSQTVMIDDLLDIARVVAGEMRLSPRIVDLSTIAVAVVENLADAATAKGITVDLALEPASSPIRGDPDRLQQIVWNILSNAVKFTPRGGHIDVSVRRSGDSIELRVVDTGIGIEPVFLGRIFERFRQADSSKRRRHGGLGIGLAIVRHLVLLHGGTVTAESDGIGHGTTILVTIPLCPPDSSHVREKSGSQRTTSGSMEIADAEASTLRGIRVLLVDDDQDGREMQQAVLELYGANVVAVGSTNEAVAAFDNCLPDIVLSDLAMPERDGIDLVRTIRSRQSDAGGSIPAVALTAFASKNDRETSLAAGFNEHIPKPASPAALIRLLKELATAYRTSFPRRTDGA